MKKKAYIIPAVAVLRLTTTDGVLLSTSGSTSADPTKPVETKGSSDWDIWSEE